MTVDDLIKKKESVLKKMRKLKDEDCELTNLIDRELGVSRNLFCSQHRVSDHYEITAEVPENITINREILQTLTQAHPEVEKLIRYKPEIETREYHNADNSEIVKMLAPALTIKAGKTKYTFKEI